MPAMTLGPHPTIVYVVNDSTAGTLKRYDVLTHAKVAIVKLANTSIDNAQVSANGQWLLFVSRHSGTALLKLQLVRMDGRYLQTLYCSTAQNRLGEVQWSTNHKLIAFVVTNSTTEHVDVLNTTSGSLQTLYSTPNDFFSLVDVRTWLDGHRLYLTNTRTDQSPDTIYLLDVNHPGTLQTVVFKGAFSDFDSSYNSQYLYLRHCVCGYGNSGPGTISVQPATGGQQQTLYSSRTDAITNVRAVLPTVLLFMVKNVASPDGGSPDNGLWKVNTDGTGVTRLTTNKAGQYPALNQFTQFPWSNVSRDGTKYVLQILTFSSSSTTYMLEYGSLNGGSPVVFASITNVQLLTVGWTTM
jgi:Tol biopolymer transport system component